MNYSELSSNLRGFDLSIKIDKNRRNLNRPLVEQSLLAIPQRFTLFLYALKSIATHVKKPFYLKVRSKAFAKILNKLILNYLSMCWTPQITLTPQSFLQASKKFFHTA